jgi:hypothetical protein
MYAPHVLAHQFHAFCNFTHNVIGSKVGRFGTPDLTLEMRTKLPSSDQVGRDTPLRLGVAASLAFPDGSMTASGLRREALRGRLMIERIAGKDYTTLANIERMRELCRVKARAPDCGSENDAVEQPSGSSSTTAANIAQARAKMISARLKTRSPNT